MGRPVVESPLRMAARLKGLTVPEPGHGRAPMSHFAEMRLPATAPDSLRAAAALARVLRIEVLRRGQRMSGVRNPAELAELELAECLDIGVSTLRKTIQGTRWPSFPEFIRMSRLLPGARDCAPSPDTLG